LGAVLACFGVASSGQGQTDQDATQLAEQYRQIVRLIARKNYDEAITRGRELLDRTNSYDEVFLRIIEAARAAGQLDQAKVLFESLAHASPPNPKGYYGLGLVQSEMEDYAAAIASHKLCLKALPEYSLPLLELVDIYGRNGNIAGAKQYLDLLLADRPDSPTANLGMGWYHSKVRDVESAVKKMDAALSVNPKLIEACYYKAIVLSGAERSEECLETLRQCLPVVEADLNEEQRMLFLNVRGRNYLRLGQYSEAIKNFEELLKIARGMEHKFYEVGTLGFLANIYWMQDDYTRAIATFHRALRVAEESNSPASIAHKGRYLGNLGHIHFELGDLLTARHYYERGLVLARDVKDFGGQANIFSNLGDLMVAQNELGQAITYYKQALETEEKKTGAISRSFYNGVISKLDLRAGDYQQAKEKIDQALKDARELKAILIVPLLLNNLGELHLRLNEPEQAVKAYGESLQSNVGLSNHSHAWVAHAGLATAYQRLGQLDQARAHYVDAIKVIEGVRAKLGGVEEKASFYQDKVEVYNNHVAVLLKLSEKYPEQKLASKAFHVAESARARAFSDLLTEGGMKLEKNLEADLLKRQKGIQASVSKLTTELINERSKEPAKQDMTKVKKLEEDLGKADAEHADWLRELRRRNPKYAELKYPEPLNLEEAQRRLDNQSLILAYSLGDQSSFLFAVSHNGYRATPLMASTAEIRDHVKKMIAAITDRNNPSPDEYRRQAAKLYQLLIRPAGKLLAGKRELIIIPDDVLHRLPFQALLGSPSAKASNITSTNPRRWPYLVGQFAISYAPSVSSWASLKDYHKDNGAPQKAFIAYADPNYNRQGQRQNDSIVASLTRGGGEQLKLNQLPYSRHEVQEIARLFAEGEAKLYLDDEASEENVKAEDELSLYRIVHFSAHGLINENRPRFSGIVLTLPKADNDGKTTLKEDGLLSAYEIFNLKLNAELVTLSACETGLGKEVRGEGMMGLTRAFMYAGAPSVVVSLWRVDDESAADLMIGFYKYWQGGGKGKLSKSEALRRAQLDAIKLGSMAYYWAPFILVGKS
jgi:CHAT domain-containing protein/Tfp pilus assembly protein PilF